MQWRKLTRLKSSPGGQSRARRMLCCGRRKENGRAAPDLTASPGRAPPGPPQPPRANHAPPCVLQPDFRKVSGVSNEIFRQIEMVENDHDSTTAAALEAVERRGEMIVRILEIRQVGRNNIEAAKKFFSLQDSRHIVQLVEIVKRPGQTLGLYIREGDGGARTDGVFISRIALESAVYNSGCLKVGDEILAVNLVDVRRMSLDDVVIIMSIPRRLLLCTRQRKGKSGPGSPSMPRSEHKPPPVVVLKRDCRDDDERDRDRVDGLYSQHGTLRSAGPGGGVRPVGDGREERSRLQLGALSPDSTALDLYYNPRPPSDHSTWSYRPPPPVITEQPKSQATHFVPYERSYPNTLDSLAEKVHSFYPADSGRYDSTRFGGRVPRSGSEQQLPRAETHSDFGRHSLLRSSLKASAATGASSLRYNQRYGGVGMPGSGLTGTGLTDSGLTGTSLGPGLPSGLSTTGLSGLTGSSLVGSGLTSSGLGSGLGGTGLGSTLTGAYGTTGLGLPSYSSKFGTARRNRSLDYSSDTEATAPTRTPYYSGLSGYRSSTLGRDIGSKFNSLPRDVRGTGQRLGLSRRAGSVLQDEPEPLSSRLDLRSSRGRLPSSPSVFTSDEYRAWLSRAPSTSALYETLRPRLPTHYSAENIHDALKNMESGSRFGSSLGLAGRRVERPRHLPARSVSSQQLGATQQLGAGAGGSPSARRVRQLLELGSRFNCPNPSPVPTPGSRHQRHLDINPNEFLKYKVEKPATGGLSASMTGLSRLSGGVSGMLWVHLLAGRGLRPSPSGASPGSPPSGPLAPPQPPVAPRDLYCVLECDRVHKARTVVRTGELQFDWDESFELDLVDNRQLDVLVYSWDPQHRHKLCYRGSVTLPDLLSRSPAHQLAIKMEPRGTLYVRFRHTEPHDLFRRRPAPPRGTALFGAELDTVVAREPRPPHAPPVPLIVRRCVEEIERRGLDIIGLYRLCGSASKKRILREAFERNARGVELAPDSVPDINVITGLLKDYLRELPQPLFSRCMYQMTLDALGICLPDDREGNARLMASVVELLPRASRATLVFLLDHLALVVAAQDRNKMSPQHLAVALAPPLMLHSQPPTEMDYQRSINVLQCLLQIWPAPKRSVRRGESVTGPRGNRVSASPAASLTLPQGRVPPSVSPYRPQAAASAASPPPALSGRPAPDRSPPAHVLSSVRAGQYRPQSPLRGPLPAPPRSRQVTVSSPGSPSSSSGSHSPADTIKHGGSVSSILRQPERAASPRSSPRSSPRASPRASPRDSPRTSTPRENREHASRESSREHTPREHSREHTPRDSSREHTPRDGPREGGSRESPRSVIPGTSAGLAVTLNSPGRGGLSPRYSSTNPFLQQYDAEEEAEAWRAADIFSSHA
ncbi:rho GTPase-activating protein 100F isoform X1 [Helicoverpa armigera]|uniref:rho GTPase-activating protein 100F isoform X1 n=2 Tax=Helicoverpa armigera TaxID=29058 RepID=UPI0021131918|nr:rho GTPase-activating protein 100F isoform X1 [Helicoverpa armigera]